MCWGSGSGMKTKSGLVYILKRKQKKKFKFNPDKKYFIKIIVG